MLDRPTIAAIRGEYAFQSVTSVLGRLRSIAVSGLLTACVGGALAFAALPLFNSGHQASARLTVPHTDQADVVAATRALKSRQSLDNLIRALDLARADGFTVNDPTLYSLAAELLSGSETTMEEAEQVLRDRLLAAMSITYDAAAKSVLVAVTAPDRAEAAAIANRLADEFRRSLMQMAAVTPSPQVEALRKTAERAEAALLGFTGKYDAAGLARLQAFEDESREREADIAAARRQLAELQALRDTAAAMKLADVLNDPLPDNLEFTGLEYQRQRYVQSRRELEHLASDLGPRHPRRAAAQAALDDAKSDIGKALHQLVASLGEQVKSAENVLVGLGSEASGGDKRKEMAAEFSQFELLRTAADEARHNLTKAEANVESAPPVRLQRLEPIMPAAAATSRAIGPDSAHVVYGGTGAGFVLGALVAMLRRRRQMQIAEEVYDFETELDVPQHVYEPAPVAAFVPAAIEADVAHVAGVAAIHHVDAPDDEFVSDQIWWDETANDRTREGETAFGDRMRGLLLDSSVPADHASLPPLLSVAVQYSRERVEEARAHGWLDDHGHLPDFDEDELNALQRELELLRELVALQEDREYRRAS